jgi:hypothetical protein
MLHSHRRGLQRCLPRRVGCRRLRLVLKDGTSREAIFRFFK